MLPSLLLPVTLALTTNPVGLRLSDTKTSVEYMKLKIGKDLKIYA